jgi:hypothetical protein
MTDPAKRVKANLTRTIVVNLAGYFIGLAVAVIGYLIHSLLVLRAGLVLVAIGAVGGGLLRLQAWASTGKRPPVYGQVSIGIRMAAAIALLVIAIRVHF